MANTLLRSLYSPLANRDRDPGALQGLRVAQPQRQSGRTAISAHQPIELNARDREQSVLAGVGAINLFVFRYPRGDRDELVEKW